MLGTRIAYLRGSLGWSQAELARRLRISPSAVGMYEQGRREPSLDMLVAMSRVFSVSLEFLLTGHTACLQDQTVQLRLSNENKGACSLLDSLKNMTREELLVLVTAALLGSEDSGNS